MFALITAVRKYNKAVDNATINTPQRVFFTRFFVV